MKITGNILKIVAIALVTAAVVCAVLAYWDKLVSYSKSLYGKFRAAREIGYDDLDFAE